MCAALPTFRKFFRHVAPRLIGESTYGKGRTSGRVTGGTKPSQGIGGISSRYGFPSRIGSRRDQEDEFQLNGDGGTFVMTNVEGGASKADSGSDDAGKGVWNDDDSEKAIVAGSRDIIQTTTIAVEYSMDPDSRISEQHTR
jgi:hypothetical protein